VSTINPLNAQVNNIDRLHRKLDKICSAQFGGLTYNCFPDLVFLSDYCWDGMDDEDIAESAMKVLQVLRDEGDIP